MNGNPDRYSREDVFEALVNSRKKAASFVPVRPGTKILTHKEYRLLFDFLQYSAQKETNLEHNPEMDDVRIDELVPSNISETAAVQLREVASVTTVQELLSADYNRVRMALAGENNLLREIILAMVPVPLAVSYQQYLESLPAIDQLFSSVRH